MKKKLVAGLITIGILAGAGVAYALWTAQGTGSGRAQAVTATTITVNAATGAADLYPGFTGGDVFFTLTNTNPYPVAFTTMVPGTITSSNQAACPASNLTVSSASGLSLAVAAGATSGTLSIANVATLTTAAPDGCQGVSFDVALTLSGSQA
jgi:hypothetical protein